MRLGAYECGIIPHSLAFKIYSSISISERHRHRLEFNNKFKEKLEKNGMIFSGINQDLNLVEMIELPAHPFFIAVQFHPEFKSRPHMPHPLFESFIKAAIGEF
jgi:CTP synthase